MKPESAEMPIKHTCQNRVELTAVVEDKHLYTGGHLRVKGARLGLRAPCRKCGVSLGVLVLPEGGVWPENLHFYKVPPGG